MHALWIRAPCVVLVRASSADPALTLLLTCRYALHVQNLLSRALFVCDILVLVGAAIYTAVLDSGAAVAATAVEAIIFGVVTLFMSVAALLCVRAWCRVQVSIHSLAPPSLLNPSRAYVRCAGRAVFCGHGVGPPYD